MSRYGYKTEARAKRARVIAESAAAKAAEDRRRSIEAARARKLRELAPVVEVIEASDKTTAVALALRAAVGRL